jgi:hypothetical protein
VDYWRGESDAVLNARQYQENLPLYAILRIRARYPLNIRRPPVELGQTQGKVCRQANGDEMQGPLEFFAIECAIPDRHRLPACWVRYKNMRAPQPEDRPCLRLTGIDIYKSQFGSAALVEFRQDRQIVYRDIRNEPQERSL